MSSVLGLGPSVIQPDCNALHRIRPGRLGYCFCYRAGLAHRGRSEAVPVAASYDRLGGFFMTGER